MKKHVLLMLLGAIVSLTAVADGNAVDVNIPAQPLGPPYSSLRSRQVCNCCIPMP